MCIVYLNYAESVYRCCILVDIGIAFCRFCFSFLERECFALKCPRPLPLARSLPFFETRMREWADLFDFMVYREYIIWSNLCAKGGVWCKMYYRPQGLDNRLNTLFMKEGLDDAEKGYYGFWSPWVWEESAGR